MKSLNVTYRHCVNHEVNPSTIPMNLYKKKLHILFTQLIYFVNMFPFFLLNFLNIYDYNLNRLQKQIESLRQIQIYSKKKKKTKTKKYKTNKKINPKED